MQTSIPNPFEALFIPDPYPPILVERPNAAYGRAMLNNLAGPDSEMSAVSLYLYNHFITGKQDNLPAIFKQIAITEMRHFDIFGELARQLGENPRLWSCDHGKMVYWTPAYNQYPMDLKGILTNCIQSEQTAVLKYQTQALQIQDPHITAILNRIILDEKRHVEIFQKIYQKYFPNPSLCEASHKDGNDKCLSM